MKRRKEVLLKKLGFLLLSLTLITGTICMTNTTVQAYNANTHTWLSGEGCLLVRASKPAVGNILYAANINGQTPASIIISTANYPDTNEQYSSNSAALMAPHFYNPKTGLNYAGGTDTANLRFQNHYQNAVILYNRGDKTNAYRELGMALHYLEDLCNPHHAANAVTGASNHYGYEKWVEDNCPYNPVYTEKSVPNYTWLYVKSNTVWQIGHLMALNSLTDSGKVILSVNAIETAAVKNNYSIKAKSDLIRAQDYAAGVIYKFCAK